MEANLKQSIFSWHRAELQNPGPLFDLMRMSNIGAVFQYVSPTDSIETIRYFLDSAAKFGKDVYFLTGEAEWALDETAKEAIQFMNWVGRLKQSSLKGIILDIEPYVLDEFKQHAPDIMVSFEKGMVKTYQAAKVHQFQLILCIPYYYDTLGFSRQLEGLVRNADMVAIMNYYRGKEIEHLRTEAQLSLKYGKPILTIYELQPPGKHGVTDQNTYYNQGIAAVYENYKQVKHAYPRQEVHLSFHEYTFYKQLKVKGG